MTTDYRKRIPEDGARRWRATIPEALEDWCREGGNAENLRAWPAPDRCGELLAGGRPCGVLAAGVGDGGTILVRVHRDGHTLPQPMTVADVLEERPVTERKREWCAKPTLGFVSWIVRCAPHAELRHLAARTAPRGKVHVALDESFVYGFLLRGTLPPSLVVPLRALAPDAFRAAAAFGPSPDREVRASRMRAFIGAYHNAHGLTPVDFGTLPARADAPRHGGAAK